jgi:uncharacterized membrane protein YfcA
VTWLAFIMLAITLSAAGFVQGAVGIGFALISAPLLALLSPALVPAGLLILMLPLNFFVMTRDRASLDWRGAGWITLGRLFGAVAGIAVIAAVPAGDLTLLVGVVTILVAIATLLVPRFTPGRHGFAIAGAVTGVTETATGIAGPPLALVYQHHPAAVLRATLACCFFVGELMSLAMLAVSGRLHASLLLLTATLLPFPLAGAAFSQVMHRRIDARTLRPLVLGFALVSGLLCLFE